MRFFNWSGVIRERSEIDFEITLIELQFEPFRIFTNHSGPIQKTNRISFDASWLNINPIHSGLIQMNQSDLI